MLGWEMPEAGEMADPIVARSLATLSYARALGADDRGARPACWPTYGLLGGRIDLARKLPARDPLRLYVGWDDSGLERIAAAALEAPTRPPPRCTVLSPAPAGQPRRLRAVVQPADEPRAAPGVPAALLLGTGLRIPYPEPSRFVAEQLLDSVGAPRSSSPRSKLRSQLPAGMRTNLAQQVERIETSLAQRPRLRGGALFGAELGIVQERAVLYTALDKVAQNSLQWLDPAEMSRWFAPGLPSLAPGSAPPRSSSGTPIWHKQEWASPTSRRAPADVDSLAPAGRSGS